MLHELDADTRLGALSDAIAQHGAARDADGAFPREAFSELGRRGLLYDLPGDMRGLLRMLAAVGRGDLSVGRIFEGHVNALFLIGRYGAPGQRRGLARMSRGGAILGVWNTDAPDDPLRLIDGRLKGKKSFASGVDGLSHAIVTVTDAGGRRMILAPTNDLAVDRTWWRPLGMRASGSHVADFTGLRVEPEWFLGGADDYIEQPWFSAGAIRFLAVQVGGMHAVLDAATAHLRRTSRAGNPYQLHRLARMGAAVETGYLWLDCAAAAWSAATIEGAGAEAQRYLSACASGARLVVETAALGVLQDAESAIGAAGMIAPHPFERLMRDMRTYLRQPNPDGAAAAFGTALAEGDWTPARTDEGAWQ